MRKVKHINTITIWINEIYNVITKNCRVSLRNRRKKEIVTFLISNPNRKRYQIDSDEEPDESEEADN